jgi:hypothetical protein
LLGGQVPGAGVRSGALTGVQSVVGGFASDRGCDDACPALQNVADLGADPGLSAGIAGGMEAPGRLPHILDDVDQVDDDGDVDLVPAGFGADTVDLVGVAVDEGDPGAAVGGVAAGGLGEALRDDRRGVIGDRGGQPLPGCGRVRPATLGFGGGVGQDVGHGAGHRAGVVDGGDLGDALAAAFLPRGQNWWLSRILRATSGNWSSGTAATLLSARSALLPSLGDAGNPRWIKSSSSVACVAA